MSMKSKRYNTFRIRFPNLGMQTKEVRRRGSFVLAYLSGRDTESRLGWRVNKTDLSGLENCDLNTQVCEHRPIPES